VARDITARKKAEAKIVDFNRTLENQVQKRTAALNLSIQEMEEFTYSISHDLRAPLRAIDGFANILAQEHSDSLYGEGQRLLHVIIQNIKKMGKLLDDLLMFAQMNRKTIRPVRIDMLKLVHDVFEKIDHNATDGKISFTTDNLPDAWGDRHLISIIIKNLISNAIKFRKTDILSDIDVGGELNGDFNTYYVKDNGIGFDMKYKDKLFGVLERLHGPEEFGGSGIGLALVQRIVEKHGGKVWAEGEVDKGAVFYFSIPNREKIDEQG
jgi:light-regulated signal transduction histidine kinase (bacteriophytochrome)